VNQNTQTISGPVIQTDRISSIDVLRGVALLGILVMNIQAFSIPMSAYSNPTAYGDLTGLNAVVWYISHLFFDQKMMSVFSMLFGAGVFLMTSRAEARLGKTAGLHYRRMGFLLLFGMIHAYLLWYGDILVYYALCGMVIYLIRKVHPWLLLIIAFILICVPSVFMLGFGVLFEFANQGTIQIGPGVIDEQIEAWKPGAEAINEEVTAMQSGWLTQIKYSAPIVAMFQTFFFLFFIFWKVTGLMLIGIALFKYGIFSAAKSTKFYLTMLIVSWAIGIPLIATEIHLQYANEWAWPTSMFLIPQINYWGSIPMALGWVALVMLFYKSGCGTLIRHALACVGQTAFTNYIFHTVVCTIIFYGRGFGLFGEIERTGQALIVIAIWIVQLILSPIWLRSYRYGPLEWLWRSLTYGKRQPLKR